jgi:hypothetical protein
MASLAFEKLYSETDLRQVSKTRKELLKYCRLDTWSMVVIYQALEQRIRK